MGITPYYLSLVDPDDPSDPIRRQVVPSLEELTSQASGLVDPLGEEAHSPVPGLTHRYPDRALMVVSHTCAVLCRHCTRRRVMVEGEERAAEQEDAMVDYIRATPAIRDVIVSGGDPLCLSTARLERIVSAVRAIPHVEIVRIGSRAPVALPQRVTPELVDMLSRYHPIWMITHFNHPRECTPDAAQAVDRLLRAGIPVNNQAVLLRGVNDDQDTMRTLVLSLVRMRVQPYYLHQCDLSKGVEHLRTPLSKGIEIMEALWGRVGGVAIPTFAVDLEGGRGKVVVAPPHLLSYDPSTGKAVFRSFEGRIVEYRDPAIP
jgi:lysine 2,3-aminomutase